MLNFDPAGSGVQLLPSLDRRTGALLPTATNLSPAKVTLRYCSVWPLLRSVHSKVSVEVANTPLAPTATKVPLPWAIPEKSGLNLPGATCSHSSNASAAVAQDNV